MSSKNSSHSSEGLCISTDRGLECINHWTVRNFKRRWLWLDKDQVLNSSPFAVDLNGKIIWVLSLRRLHDDFELSLTLQSNGAQEDANLPTYYEFIIKSAAKEKCVDFSGVRCFKVKESTKRYFEIQTLEQIQELEHDDDITITCKLVVSAEYKNWSHQFPARLKSGTCKFELDFIRLLDSGEFSDITIEANGVEFKAHKALLIARSEYFRAMLTHDTIEANTGQVKVSDIDPQVMRAVLRFIYSGNIEINSLEETIEEEVQELEEEKEGQEEEHVNDFVRLIKYNDEDETTAQNNYHRHSFVIDLLKAADRYQLEDLKLHCELTLGDRISSNSAPDLLKLAHIYRADILKNRVIQFTIVYVELYHTNLILFNLYITSSLILSYLIFSNLTRSSRKLKSHAKEVNGVERLRNFLKEHPELSVELFEAYFKALASGLEPRATRVTVESETSN